MATILAGMPELRRRFLEEHAPDPRGRCRECRNGTTAERDRPCLPYRIACEAERIAEGGPHVPRQLRSPLTSAVSSTGPGQARRLKSVPAASWQPRW